MPYSCAVSDCKNTYKNKKSDVIFHRFPIANKILCDRWIQLCRRQTEFNPATTTICNKHFSADAYERDLRNELLGLPTRKKLKADAIPTIFQDRDDDEEDQDEADDIPQPPRKYPSCMICASPIMPPPDPDPLGCEEDNVNGNDASSNFGTNISEAEFLKALDIFSTNLNLGNNGEEGEEWEIVLGMRVDFVGSVCCAKCGNLLKMLVVLRELIRETEMKLMNTVNQLETTVINSEAQKEDVKYSIESCLRFREEVLKGFSRRKMAIDTESSTTTTMQFRSSSLPVKRKLEENENALSKFPRVELEKLSMSETGNSSYSLLKSSTQSMFDEDACGESYRPANVDVDEKDSGSLKMKGRKKRKPKVLKIHEDVRSSEIKSKKKVKFITPEKDEIDETTSSSIISVKEEHEQDLEFQDDESLSFAASPPPPASSSEEDLNDPISDASRSPRPNRIRKSRKVSGKLSTAKIKKRNNNDLEHRRRAEALLGEDIPVYSRPFRVIDKTAGILTYYNCKVQMEHDRLLCKHPDCNYEHVFDYFTISMFYACLEMRKHIRMEHRGRKTGFHSCPFCDIDLQFDERTLLIQHVQSEHLCEDEPLPCLCEVCGLSLPWEEFMDHVFTHKNSDELQLAREKGRKDNDILLPKDFPCDKCDQCFDALHKYRMHSKNHHIPIGQRQREQFQCETCGEWKVSRGQLNAHIWAAHPKDGNVYPYQCNICGRKYNRRQKRRYFTHLLLHSGELPFKCSRCDKGFRSMCSLRLHQDIHDKDKQDVQCEFCAAVFRTYRDLRKHQRNRHRDMITIKQMDVRKQDEHLPGYHGPKLMFPCEPCGKVYAFKSQLITHLKKQAHNMFLEKNEDYPNMITLEDYPQLRVTRNKRVRRPRN